MIHVLALIGLAGSLAALWAVLDEVKRDIHRGYWTTNSERYR